MIETTAPRKRRVLPAILEKDPDFPVHFWTGNHHCHG